MEEILKAIGISMLPIAELRGGIPYALLNNINPFVAYIICCLANCVAFPIVYLFLGIFHEKLLKWSFYEKLFNKFVARTRKKLDKSIDKWGFWGLMIFVMIPLPVTGAYTGSFAAWLFNIKKREAFLAITLGIFIAGIIVSGVVLLGQEFLPENVFDFLMKLFTKKLSH